MNEQTVAVVAGGHIPSRIAKTAGGFRVRPNLVDYAAVRAAFSWESARESLAGLPGGGLNIAYEAVDHHLGTAHTMRNFRTAFYRAGLFDYNSAEQWQAEGAQDAQQRAHQKYRQLLADYTPPSLDPAVDEALQAFMARRKQEIKPEY